MGTEPGLTSIRHERVGAVLEVTIDNPRSELNVVDAEMHHELAELLAELTRERDARAVLLTGSKRAFSAGGDYAWFTELRDPAPLDALRADARRIITDLLDVEVPVVCALNGPAVGLGASIALLCDVILMADTATISDPHARRDRGGRRRDGDLAAGARPRPRQAVPAHGRPADGGGGRAPRPGRQGGAGGRLGSGGSRSPPAWPRARPSRCATPSSRSTSWSRTRSR